MDARSPLRTSSNRRRIRGTHVSLEALVWLFGLDRHLLWLFLAVHLPLVYCASVQCCSEVAEDALIM